MRAEPLPGLGLEISAADVARGWDRIPAPAGYERPWRSLRRACEDAGVAPEDLGGPSQTSSGFGVLAETRGWKPATIALYAKVARFAGVADMAWTAPTPEPAAVRGLPTRLWSWPADNAEQARAVAWCRATAGWPATLSAWRDLRIADVDIHGTDLRIAGGTVIGGAGDAWASWLHHRSQDPLLAASDWALCTVHTGRHLDPATGDRAVAGVRASTRGLTAAFRRHCIRVADTAPVDEAAWYRNLTYSTLRRSAIAAGADAVDRGATRAARARRQLQR